jgi:hypothetical protein
MPQHFINGTEVKGFGVGIYYKSVLALAKAIN